LAWFLLLTIIGVAHAQESPIIITTDKTTYNPGDTVYVTVTSTIYPSGGVFWIIIVPIGNVSPFTSSVGGANFTITSPQQYEPVTVTEPVKLFNNATSGYYHVEIMSCQLYLAGACLQGENNDGFPADAWLLYQDANVLIMIT